MNVKGDLTVSGGDLDHTYKVAQFHVHFGKDKTQGSEHTVDGKPYPLEVSQAVAYLVMSFKPVLKRLLSYSKWKP